jgi:hypothetical protein
MTYGQEASLKPDRIGQMFWAAYIKWPGAPTLDVRDDADLGDLLNELGADGWELVSEAPAGGINSREFTFKREKPKVSSLTPNGMLARTNDAFMARERETPPGGDPPRFGAVGVVRVSHEIAKQP